MKDECINCGAWKGLHHYETNQCPRNGQEAPLGKMQEWGNTTYQEDNTADLYSRIATLTTSNTRLQATYDHVEEINLRYAEHIQELTAHNAAMQDDAVNNTVTINLLNARIANITAAIEDIKIYCNNPSAWENYDDGVSKKIRAILKVAGVA